MTEKKGADFNRDIAPIIRKYMEELKFGSITLVVQDGQIIQIEKNEKIRLK